MKSNMKYHKFAESCDRCLKYNHVLDTSTGKILCEDCYNLLTSVDKCDIINPVRKEVTEDEKRGKKFD